MITTSTFGLSIKPSFNTTSDPFGGVTFETRHALIQSVSGKTVFEQKGVEVPAGWSDTATNIVASKYFHGKLGSAEREYSVKQLISRVVNTITEAGLAAGYFDNDESAEAFRLDLSYLLVRQYVAFNSPVWFNVGCAHLEPENKGVNWHWNPASVTVEQGATGYSNPPRAPASPKRRRLRH